MILCPIGGDSSVSTPIGDSMLGANQRATMQRVGAECNGEIGNQLDAVPYFRVEIYCAEVDDRQPIGGVGDTDGQG